MSSSSSNSERGARFLQRMQKAAKLEVTVLASCAKPAALSETSSFVARRLIGGLLGQRSDQVDCLAAKLDKLVAADRGSDQCLETATA